MPDTLRRRLLQTAVASVLSLIAPRAFAQVPWGTAAKLLLEALNGISGALGISQYISKWFGDKRCVVSLSELEDVKYQCQIMALSLDFAGSGALPLLKMYIEKGDQASWLRAKTALGTLLNNGKELMLVVNDLINKLDPETFPGPQEEITELYSGISRIRAAVSIAASLPDRPEPETITVAKSVFSSLSELPPRSSGATRELELAVEERRRASC